MQETIKKETRFSEIDLLRFLAAFTVMLFHYTFRGYPDKSALSFPSLAPIFKYGYLGVDLFFMISGYVILMTALGKSSKGFLISRIVRLYPAFWACCTITFLTILLLGGQYFSTSIGVWLANLSMLSELFNISYIDGVYWSLLIEIKFYSFITLMLIFNQLKFIKNYLWVWLILSFIATHINIGLINKILFPDYSAYFIAGCVFYLIYLEGLDLNKLSLVIASYVLASKRAWILLHNELIPNYRTEFEIPIILAIMSLFYIVFFLIAKNKTSLLRSDKWLILGALTYPLYLIHQNIGYMVFNNLHTHINHYALLIGTIFGMLILAYLVHEFVEKKFAVKLKNLLTKII